jgi:hypothetical protein
MRYSTKNFTDTELNTPFAIITSWIEHVEASEIHNGSVPTFCFHKKKGTPCIYMTPLLYIMMFRPCRKSLDCIFHIVRGWNCGKCMWLLVCFRSSGKARLGSNPTNHIGGSSSPEKLNTNCLAVVLDLIVFISFCMIYTAPLASTLVNKCSYYWQ